MQTKQAKVLWQGREEVTIDVQLDQNDGLVQARLSGVGGPQFLNLLKTYRESQLAPAVKQKTALKALPLPEGTSIEAICLREALLKLKGEWNYPYTEEELCHCRAVPTAVVDQAICTGAHTTRQVSERTSASTACGTCRPDVEAILKFRLGK